MIYEISSINLVLVHFMWISRLSNLSLDFDYHIHAILQNCSLFKFKCVLGDTYMRMCLCARMC